jgi:hypothetical protein
MFAIFNNDIFYSFWGNKKEEVWARKTIEKLNLDSPLILWYNLPLGFNLELYRFDENKNIVVQNLNEEGQLIDTDLILTAELYIY